MPHITYVTLIMRALGSFRFRQRARARSSCSSTRDVRWLTRELRGGQLIIGRSRVPTYSHVSRSPAARSGLIKSRFPKFRLPEQSRYKALYERVMWIEFLWSLVMGILNSAINLGIIYDESLRYFLAWFDKLIAMEDCDNFVETNPFICIYTWLKW